MKNLHKLSPKVDLYRIAKNCPSCKSFWTLYSDDDLQIDEFPEHPSGLYHINPKMGAKELKVRRVYE